MIEADGVANLVRKRIAQIVNLEITVEADFPAAFWVKADQGL